MFNLKALFFGNRPKAPELPPKCLKTSMNPEEFRRRLEKGERHFKGLSLSCVDLRGFNLDHLVLTDSELSGCDLSFASLLQANFSRTNLDRANLTGAFLNGANLFQASLIGANLSHSHAMDAEISYANLRYANLTWSNLSGANLSGANLTEVNLSGTNLEGANFEHSQGRDQGLKMLRLSVGGRIISLNSPRSEKGSRQIS
jgi:uncharacterized protein YjbI with pentapeptide repeats